MTYIDKYPRTSALFSVFLYGKRRLADIDKEHKGKIIVLRKFFAEADDKYLDAHAPFSELTDLIMNMVTDPENEEWRVEAIKEIYNFFSDEIYNIWDEATDAHEIKQAAIPSEAPLDAA
jgi:hypothetical protein